MIIIVFHIFYLFCNRCFLNLKYSKKLDKSIKIALDDLINEYNNKAIMFDRKENLKYLKKYKYLKTMNKV